MNSLTFISSKLKKTLLKAGILPKIGNRQTGDAEVEERLIYLYLFIKISGSRALRQLRDLLQIMEITVGSPEDSGSPMTQANCQSIQTFNNKNNAERNAIRGSITSALELEEIACLP